MSAQPVPRPRTRRAKGPAVVVWARGETTRTWTVRPWLLWASSLTVAAFCIMTIGSAALMLFEDDVVRGTLQREALAKQAYEKRIAHLRMQVDQMTSRQVAQDRIMRRQVRSLVERQRELSRQRGDLDRATLKTGVAPDLQRKADLHGSTNDLTRLAERQLEAGDTGGFQTLAEALRETEQAQFAELSALRQNTAGKVQKLVKLLRKQGVRLPSDTAVGGPLIEMSRPGAFTNSVRALDEQMETLAKVRRAALFVPHGSPTPNAAISSRFGRRKDPFTKRRAVHGGLDFRAKRGTPVLATASGRVTKAGRLGGYGKLVEIDHGGGITTRYAHLSRIDVKRGDRIRRGLRIGRVGSTGRSTGPHLHYEVRRKGRVLNPIHYVKLAKDLAPLLR